MKFLILTIITLFTSSPLLADSVVSVAQDPSGSMFIDVYQACHDQARCDIEYKGIKIAIQGGTLGNIQAHNETALSGWGGSSVELRSDQTHWPYSTFQCLSGPQIVSNVPISGVRMAATWWDQSGARHYFPSELNNGNFSEAKGAGRTAVKDYLLSKPVTRIGFETINHSPCVISLKFDMGAMPDSFTSSLKASSLGLLNLYKGAQQNLDVIRDNIAESHLRHLARFSKALEDGIASLGLKKDGSANLAVAHRDVMESARMVVVMGTVLDQLLLKDYQRVAAMRPAIETLRNTVNALRESYGFGNSLAGKPSAAIGSLAALMRLEIREIMVILSAMNDQGANQAASRVLKKANLVQATAAGQDGGDAACKPVVEDLAKEWNGQEFQAVLAQIENGGADFDNLIQGKLRAIYDAVEGLSDWTGVTFNYPTGSKVAPKANVKVTKG